MRCGQRDRLTFFAPHEPCVHHTIWSAITFCISANAKVHAAFKLAKFDSRCTVDKIANCDSVNLCSQRQHNVVFARPRADLGAEPARVGNAHTYSPNAIANRLCISKLYLDAR